MNLLALQCLENNCQCVIILMDNFLCVFGRDYYARYFADSVADRIETERDSMYALIRRHITQGWLTMARRSASSTQELLLSASLFVLVILATLTHAKKLSDVTEDNCEGIYLTFNANLLRFNFCVCLRIIKVCHLS